MRERVAQGSAILSALLVGGAAVLFATLQGSGTPPEPHPGNSLPQPSEPDTLLAFGRKVYDEEGCAACHSIAGVGGRRSALDGVGSRLPRDTIRLWIVNPQAVRPGIRKPAYADLSQERLEALVVFMESLAEGRTSP